MKQVLEMCNTCTLNDVKNSMLSIGPDHQIKTH